MKSEKLFEDFKDNSIMKEFLDGLESQSRWNITLINSISEHLKASDDPDTVKTGFALSKQCNQMMKMFEIYSMISAAVSTDSLSAETIEIQKEINELIENCRCFIEKCRFTLTQGEIIRTNTVKKLFLFILVLYIRSVVLKGATEIEIFVTQSDKTADISLKIKSRSIPAQLEIMRETFSLDHAVEMMQAAAEKINSVLTVNDEEMKLSVPIVNDENTLKNTQKFPRRKQFNIYSNLLSDISDITNI